MTIALVTLLSQIQKWSSWTTTNKAPLRQSPFRVYPGGVIQLATVSLHVIHTSIGGTPTSAAMGLTLLYKYVYKRQLNFQFDSLEIYYTCVIFYNIPVICTEEGCCLNIEQQTGDWCVRSRIRNPMQIKYLKYSNKIYLPILSSHTVRYFYSNNLNYQCLTSPPQPSTHLNKFKYN